MLDDQEYLLYAYKGNTDAIALVLMIAEISHIWDDLIDKDKLVCDAQINRAFAIALLELPRNPYYQSHHIELLPVMTTGVLNWLTANKYEKNTDTEAHALAHVMRYGIADIALFIAYLIGGQEWAEVVSPELRRRSQKDTLKNYLYEIKVKNNVNI